MRHSALPLGRISKQSETAEFFCFRQNKNKRNVRDENTVLEGFAERNDLNLIEKILQALDKEFTFKVHRTSFMVGKRFQKNNMQVHRTSFMVGKDFKKEYEGASHLFYGRNKILKKDMQVHRTCFMVNIMANTYSQVNIHIITICNHKKGVSPLKI